MKKIITLLAILISFAATAQTLPLKTAITLNIGTSGYVTINGNNYKRGDLRSVYHPADSSIGILYMPDRTTFVNFSRDTFFIYGDSSSRKARSYSELKTWFNTNFEYRGN